MATTAGGKRIELALKQKHQADDLVETLTRRCDELRNLLASDRKEREAKFEAEIQSLHAGFELETERQALRWGDEKRQLEQRISRERSEKIRLANRLSAALDKVQELESKLEELALQNNEYKAVAQAAVIEASEVVKLLAHLNTAPQAAASKSIKPSV